MNLQLARSSKDENFQIKYMTGLEKALKPELNIWMRIEAKQETRKPSAESDCVLSGSAGACSVYFRSTELQLLLTSIVWNQEFNSKEHCFNRRRTTILMTSTTHSKVVDMLN